MVIYLIVLLAISLAIVKPIIYIVNNYTPFPESKTTEAQMQRLRNYAKEYDMVEFNDYEEEYLR